MVLSRGRGRDRDKIKVSSTTSRTGNPSTNQRTDNANCCAEREHPVWPPRRASDPIDDVAQGAGRIGEGLQWIRNWLLLSRSRTSCFVAGISDADRLHCPAVDRRLDGKLCRPPVQTLA